MAFDNEETEPDDLKTISGKDLKQLKKEAKEARDAAAARDAAQRELSFYKAGVDLEHPMADYFVRGYSGEPTPEAVKAEWERLTGSGGQPSPTDAELAVMQGGADLTTGSGLPPDKLAERDRKLRDAKNEKEFDAIFAEYGGMTGSLQR